MDGMRVSGLATLLLGAATLVACGFHPGGQTGGDEDAAVDALDVDACVRVGPETCEGTDEDCDGMIDEGLTTNAPCDGPDADQCLDDMTVCNAAGAVVCGDTSGDDDAETCNGADDDCDTMIDEGFMVAAMCDGADTDLCLEGTLACSQDGTGTVCSDTTTDTVELCNHADDDCDMVIDNGFDLQTDEENCGECGNLCTNALGTTSCLAAHCTPVCNNGAAECDGDPDNGCELQDTNPVCNASAVATISIAGDVPGSMSVMGTTESVVKIHVREDNVLVAPLTARIALESGTGTNYDLVVTCFACGGIASDPSDTIDVGRDDAAGDRDFDVYAEVRYNGTTPSTTCAPWTLTVSGGVMTAARCVGTP
jgi:hypothetical protein